MGPTISGRPNTYVYWNTTLTSPTVSPDAVSTLAGKLGGGYHPPVKINYADFNYPVPASAYRAQPRCYEAPLSWSYYNVTAPLFGSTATWEVATRSEFASENQCSTIYDDYRPIISIPPEFSSMSPQAHAGRVLCPFSFDTDAVFFDPPKALTQADSLDGVNRPGGQSTDEATTTKEAPSQSAEPGTLPGPETPSATLTSETMAASKTTQAQASATSARPETSAEDGSQVQTPDPTGFSNGDAQTTSVADPQTTRDPSSGVADDSDNGDTRTNTAGAEEDDQSQVQTSAGTSSATAQGDVESQPSSDGSGATAGSATSRNVGEIIASALGMTTAQSAESSPTSTGIGDSGGDAQDPDTQDATESVEDSDPDSQASDGSSGSASGTSASEGSQSDDAGSSSDGNVDNTTPDSGTAGTSGDQGSSDTASDGNASAGSSSGDSGFQSGNAESASTGDVDNAASSSDPDDTTGDQSSSGNGSDGNASADSSNDDSDSSNDDSDCSNDGVDDSAQGQPGSNSGSGSSNHASGSQAEDESSGSSSDAGDMANGHDDNDEGSSVDSDSSGSQAGDSGSSDPDSTGPSSPYTAAVVSGSDSSGSQAGDSGSSDPDFTGPSSPYTAAVVSGSDTTVTLSPAKSDGAVFAGVTLSPGESTSVPGIGNVVAVSSGVIADGSTKAFSAIGTGAPESGQMTGAVLSRSSDSAITISQASGGGAVVGSATLRGGEQTYVPGLGNVIVQPSGVEVEGSTQAYSTITPSPESNSVTDGDTRAQEFTIDGKTYTASSATGGDIMIANDLSTATLDAAGDLATMGTVILSAGSSGQLMLGSSTISMTAVPTASAFTAGQQTFTAGSDGDYLIGSQTLTAGGAVTMSGTTYSRPTSGSGVVVNGLTQGVETGQSSESESRSTEPSGSTSTSSTTGQEGSSFIVPGATSESTTPASGANRLYAVGGLAGIVVAMALLNAI
ncbi:hypothetical protein KC343_g5664 [Hortaea werneckii]|uniref:Uncharacterized protein n=1 Tax=Hortaea werneckii TaxID=91943 RepID=A0A3M7FS33_HORWE|nr:hypothetical protein KC352_g9649 [Hortaea werneckii]KAI7568735.1 hypothetical protein KC317_g3927 [Hortaea werneckii]KAI7623337.1 hypothetical protein KC346_g2792 [Hortaea werneckii]KAI7628606.1 hypothetical protein KC343_g5664 [Hortaea werneckii]KAI7678897.1 hypothetical protein KC319_g3061 [Hortaea werneckii]